MNIKTINLTGAEVAVKVGGGNSEIKNNGTETIYASAASGIVAGADGVVSIPAGASVTVTDTRGTVYILGTGSVEVVGKDFVAPVFKTAASSGGGTTEDTIAREAIGAHAGNAEIHVTAEEKSVWNSKADGDDNYFLYTLDSGGNKHGHSHLLRAQFNVKNDGRFYIQDEDGHQVRVNHADNADTVGGLGTSDLVQNMGFWSGENIQNLILSNNSGCVFFGPDVTGMPLDNTYWFGFLNNSNGLKQLTVYQIDGSYVGSITYNNTNEHWSEWKSFADGGNAASVGAYTEEKIAALEARIAALEGK